MFQNEPINSHLIICISYFTQNNMWFLLLQIVNLIILAKPFLVSAGNKNHIVDKKAEVGTKDITTLERRSDYQAPEEDYYPEYEEGGNNFTEARTLKLAYKESLLFLGSHDPLEMAPVNQSVCESQK